MITPYQAALPKSLGEIGSTYFKQPKPTEARLYMR